jgi:hypothetical protein
LDYPNKGAREEQSFCFYKGKYRKKQKKGCKANQGAGEIQKGENRESGKVPIRDSPFWWRSLVTFCRHGQKVTKSKSMPQ